tara:strand:- start:812 stop:1330 length:519 start_codon:yes stop_codon:yes gene_type:complete
MIIQCTSCEKKFNVPDGAISKNGRLVQCSVCGNKWTQYPVKKISTEIKTKIDSPKTHKKKAIKRKKTPVPYSEEYMKQKWGTNIKSYAEEKGLIKKSKKIISEKKASKEMERSGFGFFNYLITFAVLSTFLIGILNFERSRLTRKFPFLEPYIEHFFESLEFFKIFILDLFR